MLEFIIEVDKVDGGYQLTIRERNGERHDCRKIGSPISYRADADYIAAWLGKAMCQIQSYVLTTEFSSLSANYTID